VEALVPITDPALERRLTEILEVNLADDALAWGLGPEGQWSRVEPGPGLNAHLRFQELALGRSRRVDT
jgi:polyphosphate kinase